MATSPPPSLLVNDREYFRDAMLGGQGQQYVVGRRTHTAGIFFSAPVYRNGTIVGITVIKLGLQQLEHWVDNGDAFVTDANGVVILANDRRLLGMAVPDAPVFTLPPSSAWTSTNASTLRKYRSKALIRSSTLPCQ